MFFCFCFRFFLCLFVFLGIVFFLFVFWFFVYLFIYLFIQLFSQKFHFFWVGCISSQKKNTDFANFPLLAFFKTLTTLPFLITATVYLSTFIYLSHLEQNINEKMHIQCFLILTPFFTFFLLSLKVWNILHIIGLAFFPREKCVCPLYSNSFWKVLLHFHSRILWKSHTSKILSF